MGPGPCLPQATESLSAHRSSLSADPAPVTATGQGPPTGQGRHARGQSGGQSWAKSGDPFAGTASERLQARSGQAHKACDGVDRMKRAITRVIGITLDKIGGNDPALAKHLDHVRREACRQGELPWDD